MTFDGWLRTPVCGLSAFTANTRANQLPTMVWTYSKLLEDTLSNQNVCVPAGTGPSGKVASFETSRRYVTASGTAVQSKWIDSHGWNVEYPRVGPRAGVPGAPGPAPVMTKLCAGDHALCPVVSAACTRQKKVPGVRPL